MDHLGNYRNCSTLLPHIDHYRRRRLLRIIFRSSTRYYRLHSGLVEFKGLTKCHLIPPYSTLLYATLRYSSLLYATLRYSFTPSIVTSQQTDIRYSTLRYATLLYATLHYSTPLYATLRYSTLLYANLRCSFTPSGSRARCVGWNEFLFGSAGRKRASDSDAPHWRCTKVGDV
jgi:hypothetical protein